MDGAQFQLRCLVDLLKRRAGGGGQDHLRAPRGQDGRDGRPDIVHRHEIAARQMDGGFGGMMSFLVKGGIEDTKTVTTSLKLFIPATSLGGVESLAEHRKIIEGPDSLVAPNLIRLSVGIEDAGDLIADLEQALDRI